MNFQWLFARPIAHRGLHTADIPENSLPAYQNAIDHNYNIEIDVHLSKDGHIVVFHDDTLKRVCGVDKKVKDCTLEELKSYRLCGTDCQIPSFDEFLEFIDGKTGILCEIKGLNPFDKSIVSATIERLKTYKGNIALQSFNFGAVKYAKRHSNLPVGELCTWHGTKPDQNRSHLVDFMGKLWICRATKPDFIAYDVRAMDKKYPENKYIINWAKKLPVLMWTINSDETLELALKYSNNIIFESLPIDTVESRIKDIVQFQCPENKQPANK